MVKLKKIVEDWRIRGAIASSSRFLVNRMLYKLDYSQDMDLLQLGYGKGVFAKGIINQMTAGSTLTIFEVNKDLRKHHISDKRITYIEDSAERVSEYFEDRQFDHIISTLPFASLPREVSENIFEQIKKHLKTNGKFLQFQYSLISRKDIHELFNVKPRIDFELLNLPPAFIYETRNIAS